MPRNRTPMPQFINVDSIKLEVVHGFPGPPGSHFRLPTGKVFGFPWKPDALYHVGKWIVGRKLDDYVGRARYIGHDMENGGTAWCVDISGTSQFRMDPDGRSFFIDDVHAMFDRLIFQVFEHGDGYWVVLNYNASIQRGCNIAFVGRDGHVHWLSGKIPGDRVPAYMEIRLGEGRFVEAWAQRCMAVIDPATLRIVSTRP